MPRPSRVVGSDLGEAAGAAEHHEAVDEGGALGPALELGGVGQAEVLDEQLADRGGHEALVAVAHGGGSLCAGGG